MTILKKKRVLKDPAINSSNLSYVMNSFKNKRNKKQPSKKAYVPVKLKNIKVSSIYSLVGFASSSDDSSQAHKDYWRDKKLKDVKNLLKNKFTSKKPLDNRVVPFKLKDIRVSGIDGGSDGPHNRVLDGIVDEGLCVYTEDGLDVMGDYWSEKERKDSYGGVYGAYAYPITPEQRIKNRKLTGHDGSASKDVRPNIDMKTLSTESTSGKNAEVPENIQNVQEDNSQMTVDSVPAGSSDSESVSVEDVSTLNSNNTDSSDFDKENTSENRHLESLLRREQMMEEMKSVTQITY